MNLRPWYTRKRVLLPLLTLVVFAAAFAYALLVSTKSSLMVYNQTGADLPPMKLTACGQTRVYGGLPSDASVRWDLKGSGTSSAIELEFATDPPQLWQGGYLAPRGGYRVTLHIWSLEQVEVHTQISFWQRWLGRTIAVSEDPTP